METKSKYFVLTLPLRTEKWQTDILDRRMRVNRDIYNALLKKAYGRYLQMTQTRAWRKIEEGLKQNPFNNHVQMDVTVRGRKRDPIQNQKRDQIQDQVQGQTEDKVQDRTRNQTRGRIQNRASDRMQEQTHNHVQSWTQDHIQDGFADAGSWRKELYRQRDALIEKYRLRKYDLTKEAAKYRQAFKENTDSPIVQNLAENVWQAIDRLVTGRGRQVHFKGPNGLNDLSGKTNKSSILYRNGIVKWKGLKLPTMSKGNAYEREALQHEIRYCRIKRREIRGKARYYVDLVLEGQAPLKHPENLEASGNVSLWIEADRRRQGFLVCGNISRYRDVIPRPEPGQGIGQLREMQGSKLCSFRTWNQTLDGSAGIVFEGRLSPDSAHDRRLERKKKKALAALYRSRKAMNPQNYTEDGRIRAGAFEWNYSKRYLRERARYRELCRRQRERRRQYQCQLADRLLASGDSFYIEEMDFSEMKRRTYHTGPGRQMRFGNRTGLSAPGNFLAVLKRKCAQYGKKYESYHMASAQEMLQAVRWA